MTLRTRNAITTGGTWLARCAPSEDAARRTWQAGELALIPSGRWLVGEAPLARSLDAMQRLRRGHLGPVLAYPAAERAWWLLPLDAADALADLRHLVVQPAGWPLYCPPVSRPQRGRVWLERPDGSGNLTDPYELGAALAFGALLSTELEVPK